MNKFKLLYNEDKNEDEYSSFLSLSYNQSGGINLNVVNYKNKHISVVLSINSIGGLVIVKGVPASTKILVDENGEIIKCGVKYQDE